MDWAAKQEAKGIKLIVKPYRNRQNTWRGNYKKEREYFRHPITKKGYEAACKEYFAWKSKIDGKRPYEAYYIKEKQHLELRLKWYDSNGIPDEEWDCPRLYTAVINNIEKALESSEELFKDTSWCYIPGEHDCSYPTRDIWADRVAFFSADVKTTPYSIEQLIDRLLESKRSLALLGNRSARTPADLRDKLKRFQLYCDEIGLKQAKHINEGTLDGYFNYLISLVAKGQFQADPRAKNLFNAARTLVRYGWRIKIIEDLPRNITGEDFEFSNKEDNRLKKEHLWTRKDFHAALNYLNPRWQCYLLLMLNCGFYSTDISNLTFDKINLKDGRIVTRREKTKRSKNPPVVNYKLWNRTTELIEETMEQSGDNVFLSKTGTPLVVSRINMDVSGLAKETNYNTLTRQWGRMKKKRNSKLPQKLQLRHLRHTGSTTLKSKKEFGYLDILYLADCFTSIPDKHYNAWDGEVFEPLDEAITWLGEQFGF